MALRAQARLPHRTVHQARLDRPVPIANQLDKTLHDVVKNGTGKLAYFEGQEAGKTGTTNDNSDMWFIGYSKNKCIATGVWLGNDTKKSTKGDSSVSAHLWKGYMQQLPTKEKCQ